jgi:hypothetical protein
VKSATTNLYLRVRATNFVRIVRLLQGATIPVMRRQLLRNFTKGAGVAISGLLVDLLKDRYIGAINRWLDAHAVGPIHSTASWIANRPFALTIGGLGVFLLVLLLHAAIVSRSTPSEIPKELPEPEEPPSLGILWHPSEKPYLHEYRMPNDPSQTLHTHFRILVANLSKKEQVRDVEVILEDLSPRTLDCIPCHLRLMNNILPGDLPIERFSLNPDRKQPIDVMMWRPGSRSFQIWHTVMRQTTDVPAQPYTMKITASAANAKVVTREFEIAKSGSEWKFFPKDEIRAEPLFPEVGSLNVLEMAETDPLIYVDIEPAKEAMFPRTPFICRNDGDRPAHKVQIRPFKLCRKEVVFPSVPVISAHDKGEALPTMENGSGLMIKNDIFYWLMKDWNDNGELVDEWCIPIIVGYTDALGQKEFEVTMNLVFYPMIAIRNKNNRFANPSFLKKEREWEFIDVGFRRIR